MFIFLFNYNDIYRQIWRLVNFFIFFEGIFQSPGELHFERRSK
nr:MAG TPA: hypothetical protein [Caudoviricetes sp.]